MSETEAPQEIGGPFLWFQKVTDTYFKKLAILKLPVITTRMDKTHDCYRVSIELLNEARHYKINRSKVYLDALKKEIKLKKKKARPKKRAQ